MKLRVAISLALMLFAFQFSLAGTDSPVQPFSAKPKKSTIEQILSNPCIAASKNLDQMLRFLKPLKKMEGNLVEISVGQNVTFNNLKKIRKHAFYLEALTELYMDLYPGQFTDVYESIRELKKKVGAYKDAIEFRERSEQFQAQFNVGSNKPFPSHIVPYAKEKEKERYSKLLKFLNENGWTTDANGKIPSIEFIREKIEQFKFRGKGYENPLLVASVVDYIKSLKKSDYDFSDIDGDVHEFKKDYRKLLAFILSLNGLLAISDDDPAINFLFTQVARLNKVKANGEYLDEVRRSYKALGYDKKDAKQLVAELQVLLFDVEELESVAESVYDIIHDTKVLKYVQHTIQERLVNAWVHPDGIQALDDDAITQIM